MNPSEHILVDAMPAKCWQYVVFIYDPAQRQHVMGSAIIIMWLVRSVDGTACLIVVINFLRVGVGVNRPQKSDPYTPSTPTPPLVKGLLSEVWSIKVYAQAYSRKYH